MDNRIKQIAEHYGYEVQREQFIEECSEAILAAQKCKRYGGKEQLEAYEGEIADVLIMALEKAHLIGIDRINQIVDMKLNRQMQRIEAENEEQG